MLRVGRAAARWHGRTGRSSAASAGMWRRRSYMDVQAENRRLTAQLPVEPRTRQCPIAFHRGGGDVEGLGGLLDGHPREESALHHARLPCISGGEALECLVEVEPGFRTLAAGDVGCPGAVERYRARATAPLLRIALDGVVHEHVTNHARADAEEVRAALPLDPEPRELEIRLVDERRGGQGVSRPLA